MIEQPASVRWLALALLLAACADEEADGATDTGTSAVNADASSGGERDASTPRASDAAAARPEAGPRDASRPELDAASSGPRPDAALRDASPDAQALEAGTDAAAPEGWKLVWSDEFDGAAGQKLDPGRWVYEVGGTGWGNNQLEFDTDRAENAALDGNGELVITARKESYMGRSYTSARLKTQGKFEHGYGRYETRMRIPFGQGIWPAFWMLGVDIGSAGWPSCGEIDIMENIGREPDTVHGTLHGPGYSGGAGIGAASKLAAGQRFADAYHVFAIEWEQDVVRWYVDGKLYQTRTPRDLPGGARWVYDHSFFVLLNLAVGGQWPGNPDASTTFPQTLRVDYVRVYERAN
jgi:beta-glucanase (GH16 family)